MRNRPIYSSLSIALTDTALINLAVLTLRIMSVKVGCNMDILKYTPFER